MKKLIIFLLTLVLCVSCLDWTFDPDPIVIHAYPMVNRTVIVPPPAPVIRPLAPRMEIFRGGLTREPYYTKPINHYNNHIGNFKNGRR